MDRLWSPWRLAYVTGTGASTAPAASIAAPAAGPVGSTLASAPADAAGGGQAAAAHPGCIFCQVLDTASQAPLVLHRGARAFVILNLYPYNNGHLMVVPCRHIATLARAEADELSELMALTRVAEMVLTEAYAPHGMNVGLNLGRAAGAGVADHLHIHVVPRWNGDTNFMTVVSDVRVLPETLDQTAARLRPLFERLAREAAPLP